jgi:hypothetical protein
MSFVAFSALVAACSVAGTGAPRPSAGSSTTPSGDSSGAVPALTEVFVSPTMGYSVSYPSGWSIYPGTEPWTPSSSNFWDDPVGDRLESTASGFRGTSQPFAEGQTAEEWLAEYLDSPYQCGDQEMVPVGDQTGTVDLNGCRGKGRLAGNVFDLAVTVDGRGYNFTMEGDVDRALWLAMLATVQFDPDAAADQ